MALSPAKKHMLIKNINKIPDEVIVQYILDGDLSLTEVPGLLEGKKKNIEILLSKNNPREIAWDKIQEMLKQNPVNIVDLENATRDFVDKYNGNCDNKYINEATKVLNYLKKISDFDIFSLKEYIDNNPKEQLIEFVIQRFDSLKTDELESIKKGLDKYDHNRLLRLIENDIFTEEYLIENSKGIVTKEYLESLKSKTRLPDINHVIERIIERPNREKKRGVDVYFFGIPSTGKSSILMGLSKAKGLSLNLASDSGEYASALIHYVEAGVTIPPTPGNFYISIDGKIITRQEMEQIKVNFVEMSGEEFAFEIAQNPESIVTFEKMGAGVTKLLSNKNRKIFFILIDPTADAVTIRRRRNKFDSRTGRPTIELETCTVKQTTVIHKLVSLFCHPSNLKIMKKVDAINFIVTKADILGENDDRIHNALSFFREKFANDAVAPLVVLSRQLNINVHNSYSPMLYPFALGKFSGERFKYDSTDSDSLVNVIAVTKLKKSIFDRL